MEIIAKLIKVDDVQSGENERGFWYRGGMVLESLDGHQRLMYMKVQGKDKCDGIAQVAVGSTLKVGFIILSREYGGRWYTDVLATTIDVMTSSRPNGR